LVVQHHRQECKQVILLVSNAVRHKIAWLGQSIKLDSSFFHRRQAAKSSATAVTSW